MLSVNKILKNSFLMTVVTLFHINILVASDKFTVAIDVGHTKARHGATSSRGIGEYQFNREIAEVLFLKVINHKDLDGFVINPEGNKIGLKDRTKMATDKQADLFISLHHDSVQEKYLSKWIYQNKSHHYSDLFSGYSIFISKKNIYTDKSYKFASILGDKLVNTGFTPTLHHAEKIKGENRELLNKKLGVYEFTDLIVLKTAAIPSVLLECGIIVNRKEELLVSSQKFKDSVAENIIQAILKYKKKK